MNGASRKSAKPASASGRPPNGALSRTRLRPGRPDAPSHLLPTVPRTETVGRPDRALSVQVQLRPACAEGRSRPAWRPAVRPLPDGQDAALRTTDTRLRAGAAARSARGHHRGHAAPWGCRAARATVDGMTVMTVRCPKCRGRGYTECQRYGCGTWHDAKCATCDGRGRLNAIPADPSAEDASRARRAWQDLKSELTFDPTPDGFRAAYSQMFGVSPDDATTNQWFERIATIAKAAGVELRAKGAHA